jgi:hypothetical protein
VLDVAGGKGDLSWLLLNHDGVDSCVVDPRRTDHTKLERQAQWLLDNPKAAAEQILTTGQLMPQLALTPPFRTPKHLRLFVDASLLEVLLSKKHDTQQQRWEQFWNDASARAEAEDTGTKLHHQPKPKLKPVVRDLTSLIPPTSFQPTDNKTPGQLFSHQQRTKHLHPEQTETINEGGPSQD